MLAGVIGGVGDGDGEGLGVGLTTGEGEGEGEGLGVGDGEGLGVGEGLGEGLGEGDGEGLGVNAGLGDGDGTTVGERAGGRVACAWTVLADADWLNFGNASHPQASSQKPQQTHKQTIRDRFFDTKSPSLREVAQYIGCFFS